MELYDAIFYRKSIEFYSTKPITEFLMEEVKKLCSNITYLNSNLNIKAHVIDRGHLINFSTHNKIQIKAPTYARYVGVLLKTYLLREPTGKTRKAYSTSPYYLYFLLRAASDFFFLFTEGFS